MLAKIIALLRELPPQKLELAYYAIKGIAGGR